VFVDGTPIAEQQGVRACRSLIAALITGVTALGCGLETGARLDPIAPQAATVGVALSIMLRAQSGGRVDFTYASDLDLASRSLKPTLTAFANGQALFSWTPLASDVGAHQRRFTASVNGVTATQTVAITVGAGADPIRFREPVGDGTTLDPARADTAWASPIRRASCSTIPATRPIGSWMPAAIGPSTSARSWQGRGRPSSASTSTAT
jgi:hypothetical protein